MKLKNEKIFNILFPLVAFCFKTVWLVFEIYLTCFLEARKIIGTYMGENSSTSVAHSVDTTNQDNKYRTLAQILTQLEPNDWPKFQEHLKKIQPAEFHQAPASATGWERREILYFKQGPTTWTRTTLKSTKSTTKYLLHKFPISPPKSVKDRLKNSALQKLKPLNLEPQAPIGQAEKIQMNTKVNNERPGSTFKIPWTKFHTTPSTSITKSSIRINKQCNAHGCTKPLKRTNRIESMDSNRDRIVARLNLEVLNNYNAWNQLPEGKLINTLTFLNVNLLRIIHIYLNVCKQMTNIKLLLLHNNIWNHLTVCK